jgi:hypothetical protein
LIFEASLRLFLPLAHVLADDLDQPGAISPAHWSKQTGTGARTPAKKSNKSILSSLIVSLTPRGSAARIRFADPVASFCEYAQSAAVDAPKAPAPTDIVTSFKQRDAWSR